MDCCFWILRGCTEREGAAGAPACVSLQPPLSRQNRAGRSPQPPPTPSDLAPFPRRARLTDYLYELSEKFNAFYVECKVIGTPEEDSRLMLVEATAAVMKQCFSLLGITPVYKL